MYCKKCGSEIQENQKFCMKCGAPVEGENQTEETTRNQKAVAPKKKSKFKKILIIVAVFLGLCVALSMCGGSDTSTSNQEYIDFVRNGSPVDYPNTTYAQAFDTFFGDPKWIYFKSDEGKDIVEFAGDCTYQEADVRATLQFTLDIENDIFEVGYFDMNGVPQNKLYTASLIATVFEDYESGGESSEEIAEPETASAEVTPEAAEIPPSTGNEYTVEVPLNNEYDAYYTEVDLEDVARNPSQYVGVNIKVKGSVLWTYGSNNNQNFNLYPQGYMVGQSIYANIKYQDGQTRIIDNDTIIIYGTYQGELDFSGNPEIDVDYFAFCN